MICFNDFDFEYDTSESVNLHFHETKNYSSEIGKFYLFLETSQ